jgi:hypothetical protein
MKKLLMILGLGLLLVGCNNGEVESLKKELEEVRAENLEMKALLAADTGTYTEADIERIAANGENPQNKAWKDGESDYDKVRDSVMAGSDEMFAQDMDLDLKVQGFPFTPGDNEDGDHMIWTSYAKNNNYIYVELNSDVQFSGISAYNITPSEVIKNGSRTIIRFEVK